MDAEQIYHQLRELADSIGPVSDEADQHLADAARAIAEGDED